MKKFLLLLLFTVFLFNSKPLSAQCSMCRRVAESNMEDGGKKGRGLNTGILYLMSVPYLMGGVGVYIWWKNKKRG